MRVEHANWPHTVLKSKWRVSTLIQCSPVAIVSEKTGHIIIDVGCDATSDRLKEIEREIAQHIVDLHNSQLGK